MPSSTAATVTTAPGALVTATSSRLPERTSAGASIATASRLLPRSTLSGTAPKARPTAPGSIASTGRTRVAVR